ncbi:uncharacterized protein EI90DRAFT_3058933 [Cantharellus anzutake]|uniref:uncharacterized protein n=1 Tax=Cantharellus anzutake TaxID=1750568 RepID=UPI001904065F|nr:uncharacterized protein EI90DRAFT_3058933 [Cantharellus anzutake]KAF8330711.1 hypothetical protein EI90DRAFT_3058933 [Cantharellus anzutake]
MVFWHFRWCQRFHSVDRVGRGALQRYECQFLIYESTTCSYLIPAPVSLVPGDPADMHLSEPDICTSASIRLLQGESPLLWMGNISEGAPIWFDGRTESTVSMPYPPVNFRMGYINHPGASYGDQVLFDAKSLALLVEQGGESTSQRPDDDSNCRQN